MVCKHRGNTWFLGLSRVLITYNICPPGNRNSYALVFITSIIINQDQIWCVNIWANTSFLGPSWVLITYNICPPGNTTTIGKRSTDQPCLSFVRSSSGLFKCWLRWTESNTWLRWTESNDLPVSINRYMNMRVFIFSFLFFRFDVLSGRCGKNKTYSYCAPKNGHTSTYIRRKTLRVRRATI